MISPSAADKLRRRGGADREPLPDPNTHDMMTILDEEEFVASALVYPGSTEEVQKVVRWANKHLIPIFPISMGRNRMWPPVRPAPAFSITTTTTSN